MCFLCFFRSNIYVLRLYIMCVESSCPSGMRNTHRPAFWSCFHPESMVASKAPLMATLQPTKWSRRGWNDKRTRMWLMFWRTWIKECVLFQQNTTWQINSQILTNLILIFHIFYLKYSTSGCMLYVGNVRRVTLKLANCVLTRKTNILRERFYIMVTSRLCGIGNSL